MATALTDLDLLARLVAIDTTSRLPTRPLGDFVAEYLALPGIRLERFDCGDGHENMLISTGPECRAGEGLLLCGHVDTVPADEPEWTSDPRRLESRDDGPAGPRVVARGACDMKGFDALAINLLREASATTLAEPLQLLLTCNEEVGTLGAAAFARAWPRDRTLPKRLLVGEPTSMRVVRGHKGHLTISIVVHGVAAHSGFPHKGVNAIERAAKVIVAFGELRSSMSARRNGESVLFPEVPFPVLTTAKVRGGAAINVIPERCELDVGVRLLPGMASAEFMEELRRVVVAALAEDAPEITLRNETPAFATPVDCPWHGEMCRLAGQTGECGVGFGTDAGRLAGLGVEPVIWGPGDISNAHRPDEWMPLDEYRHAATLLRRLVR